MMKNMNRVSLSPLLKKFKFYFDLIKRTTDAYLFCMDLQERIFLVSPNLVQDFDLPGEVLADFSSPWRDRLHPEDREAYMDVVSQALEASSAGDYSVEFRVRNRKDEYVWLSARGRVGTDREGKPCVATGMLTRMAGRNRADVVTGLLNKYQFEHNVKLALEKYRTTSVGGAIMVFGLDNFKIVNETYNRAMGDLVLKHVSKWIGEILPPMLTLYKLDGDEFAIIYPGAEQEQVDEIFSGIQMCLAHPKVLEGHTFYCTISAGTVFYPEAGKDYLVLHKHAEAAMDLAKKDGKNRNCIFSKDQYNRWVRSVSMRDSMRESVENGCEGFSLFFQPQVDAATRRIVGAEALLRWKNPKGHMVSPMEFIPILEETKLIIPVGRWVFEEALKICKKWRRVTPEFKVSINMSYEQVKDPSFKEFVDDCLARYQMPSDSITLELTESKIIADWNFVNREFEHFRKKGISIAMDDFGTGYSSLSTLKNLCCDIVKIDREFVKKILENDFDRQLVKYTVELCHSIGITTCIEGVEEEAEYKLLTEECHADFIQGYFFGRPESVESFEEKFLGLHP